MKARLLSPTCTEHPQHRLPSASHKSLLSEPVARYSKIAKEMTIFVRLDRGKEVAVALPRNETVLNLKEKVRDLSQTSSHGYQLFFRGIALNEGKSLKAYGIAEGDMLQFAPWQVNSLVRPTFLGNFYHGPDEKGITVTVQTPRGCIIDINVLNSDPVRSLWEKIKKTCRFELFQNHELVYGHKVLRANQQIAEIGLQSMSVLQIVLRITIKLTSLKGTKWTVQVLASDLVANVKDDICDEPSKKDFVEVCCEGKVLNAGRSFEFYRIRPQMSLYGKVRVPLEVQTPSGKVSIIPFEDSTVWKVTLLTVITAGMNPYERYQLLSEGVALSETSLLKDAQVKYDTALELQKIGTPHVFPPGPNGVSGHLILMTLLKHILVPIPVVATKKTMSELLQDGFQRKYILDPFELYPSLLIHSHDRDYSNGERMSETIRIDINVLSYGRFSISVSTSESVQALKEIIEEKSNLEVWKQKLIYAGTVLEGGCPIDFYSIRDGATITLVVEDEHKYFLLPSDRFDFTSDQDFTEVQPTDSVRIVGGEPCQLPYGWKRYALRGVEGGSWANTTGAEGEWPFVYHSNNSFEPLEEFRTANFEKGGVVTAGDIRDIEESITPQPWEGNTMFKFAFQSRVNPYNMKKSPDSRFFVSPHEKDVRPFGFLVKFIRPEEPQ